MLTRHSFFWAAESSAINTMNNENDTQPGCTFVGGPDDGRPVQQDMGDQFIRLTTVSNKQHHLYVKDAQTGNYYYHESFAIRDDESPEEALSRHAAAETAGSRLYSKLCRWLSLDDSWEEMITRVPPRTRTTLIALSNALVESCSEVFEDEDYDE